MKIIEEKFNKAKIFTDVVEEMALNTVSEFKKQMKNIYTTSVNAETLDECPMAYKNMEDIISNISESVEILKVIKPIYNFKAGEK